MLLRFCPQLLFALAAIAAERPWQRVTIPSTQELRHNFASPPVEYGITVWWWWNGPMTQEQIRRDLLDLKEHGARSVMLWAYVGLEVEYLSPEWFRRVRFAVNEAKRLNLRVWLMDEGSYPSGFAGGLISKRDPDLRMRALRLGAATAPDALPPNLWAIFAKTAEGSWRHIADRFSAKGDVVPVMWEFRTNPTRYVHAPGFSKDAKYSFIDPLNPAATRRFLAYTHEEYEKYIGDEFGKTVLGFMGDEPSVAGMPWTPALIQEFRRRKGYDLMPHLIRLVQPAVDEESRRVLADYRDVWTDLYHENFFRVQSEWCAKRGLEYIVHLCGEEDLKTMVQLNGDYFKCNRSVQVPGVDAIWRQVWPGKVQDYPKLASSAAHVYGKPRAFTESYGVYGSGISIEQAKWVLDYQYVRGINQFQAMGFSSSNEGFKRIFSPPNWNAEPQWKHFRELADYASRLSYVLSVGRPVISTAVYYPTFSGWMDQYESEKDTLAIARTLLEAQRDFDFVDDHALAEVLLREGRFLTNRSGQMYSAVVLASSSVISAAALQRLRAFANAGGTVVVAGAKPSVIVGKNFLTAGDGSVNPLLQNGKPSTATVRTVARLEEVVSVLESPDLSIQPESTHVRYVHRSLSDGEVYWLFNEGDAPVDVMLQVRGRGGMERWDPANGTRQPVYALATSGMLKFPLHLEKGETALFVTSPSIQAAVNPPRSVRRRITQTLNSKWRITIKDRSFESRLIPWAELGFPSFSGTGKYEIAWKQAGSVKDCELDLGEVRYAAHVFLNGRELAPKAWQPFRWVIGDVASGENRLTLEVTNTGANTFAGDPAAYASAEKNGWVQNSYVRLYLDFDREMLRSGLIGPVSIRCAVTTRE
jgi:hypothetical protein